MHRRQFLRHTVTSIGTAALPALAADDAPSPPLCSFFLVGDTHFLAEKLQPDLLNETSARYCRGLVNTMNELRDPMTFLATTRTANRMTALAEWIRS